MIIKGNLTMTERKSTIELAPRDRHLQSQVVNGYKKSDPQVAQLHINSIRLKLQSKAKNTFQETRDKLTLLQESIQLANNVKGVI